MADEPLRPGQAARPPAADELLVRAPIVRAYDLGDATTLVGPDGTARRFEADSAALLRAVLESLSAPRTRTALAAEIAVLAGGDPGAILDELIALLLAMGAIVRVTAPAGTATASSGPLRRLVLGISGAVAAVDSPALVRALHARRFDVWAMATSSARQFIGLAGLESITHRKVYSHIGQRDRDLPVPHVGLAEWADVVVICPATATTLARIATGDCSDLVSAVAIATRAPVVIVPSMNEAMYRSPSVQRNLAQLREDGFAIVHPALGVEVAHAPAARRAMLGPAPPGRVVAELVDLIVATATMRSNPAARAEPEIDWERLYADTPAELLPWFTETLDDDVAAAIGRLLPGARGHRALDLGTGLGSAAIGLARRGFDVVATDVAASALLRARGRAGELPIAWVLDDALDSHLWGEFDLVHDRACLHCLPRARWDTYVTTVARLTRPGGWLLLKGHDAEAAARHGTQALDPGELARRFGPAFQLVETHDSSLPGRAQPAPGGLLAILRRLAA
jgi:SAM-dependent methyltransferase/3-polyprenyl-4-hydroxybenzoate decarboxylase